MRPLRPGDPTSAGAYSLLGRLGMGGMGVVYLGHHPDHGLVAVKLLRSSYHVPGRGEPWRYEQDGEADSRMSDDLRRRFRAEVEFARRVASCATARVIEDGTAAAQPYIVTEYIQGPPLHVIVGRVGPLSFGALRAVALGVAAALAAVHRAGLVHRDVKPANLLLARTGPRVIDFGLAADVDIAGGHTQTGVVMGSPGWIAPERLAGEPATAASDLFCWGCLVAYAGTGQHPFGEGTAAVMTDRIMHGEPDLSGLPTVLRGPVATTLSKDPEMRPTAAELLRMLLAPVLRGTGPSTDDDVERIAATVIAKIWRPPADPLVNPDVAEPVVPGVFSMPGAVGQRHGRAAPQDGSVVAVDDMAVAGAAGDSVMSAAGAEGGGAGGSADHSHRAERSDGSEFSNGAVRGVSAGTPAPAAALDGEDTGPRFGAARTAFGWTLVGWTAAAAALVAAMAYGLDAGRDAEEQTPWGVVVSPARPGVRSGPTQAESGRGGLDSPAAVRPAASPAPPAKGNGGGSSPGPATPAPPVSDASTPTEATTAPGNGNSNKVKTPKPKKTKTPKPKKTKTPKPKKTKTPKP